MRSPRYLQRNSSCLTAQWALTERFRFDAEAMTWEPIAAEGDWIGDVAVVADSIHYVRYTAPPVVPTPFTIERIDPNGEHFILIPVDETFIARDAAIAADGDGTVFVVTESQKLTLSPEGTVISRLDLQTERPIVALSPNGTPLWSGADTPSEDEWHITDGSDEAKTIITKYSDCSETGLTVGLDNDETTLPFLCEASAAAWLDYHSFVISAGTELGTVLARVEVAQLSRAQ
jgi:hypothetical protein